MTVSKLSGLVAWFPDLPLHAVEIAGGKGASLSDMVQAKMSVPPGFVVCAASFRAFLDMNGGIEVILGETNALDINTEVSLSRASKKIHDFILSRPIPDTVDKAIRQAYTDMGTTTLVAVRSSAISEDGEAASFAGQQDTFLNIRGTDQVVNHVRECWASFFSPRAMFYRAQKGSLNDAGMAVVVQKMVKPSKSGVMFTVDPIQGERDHMVIEAIFGLGEAIVSGQVTPDHYVLNRKDGSLVREHIAHKLIALIHDEASGGTRQMRIPAEQAASRVLSDKELASLKELGLKLEKQFGKPQDIEWCIEGKEILLLQSRPITTLKG